MTLTHQYEELFVHLFFHQILYMSSIQCQIDKLFKFISIFIVFIIELCKLYILFS